MAAVLTMIGIVLVLAIVFAGLYRGMRKTIPRLRRFDDDDVDDDLSGPMNSIGASGFDAQ